MEADQEEEVMLRELGSSVKNTFVDMDAPVVEDERRALLDPAISSSGSSRTSSAEPCSSSRLESRREQAERPNGLRGMLDKVGVPDEGLVASCSQESVPAGVRKLAASRGLDIEQILPKVPRDDQDQLTSLGSVLHATHQCVPCAFAHMECHPEEEEDGPKQGCVEGVLCRFCHFPHPAEDKIRLRPCKAKRKRYRRLLEQLTGISQGGAETTNSLRPEAMPPSDMESLILAELMKSQFSASSGFEQSFAYHQQGSYASPEAVVVGNDCAYVRYAFSF